MGKERIAYSFGKGVVKIFKNGWRGIKTLGPKARQIWKRTPEAVKQTEKVTGKTAEKVSRKAGTRVPGKAWEKNVAKRRAASEATAKTSSKAGKVGARTAESAAKTHRFRTWVVKTGMAWTPFVSYITWKHLSDRRKTSMADFRKVFNAIADAQSIEEVEKALNLSIRKGDSEDGSGSEDKNAEEAADESVRTILEDDEVAYDVTGRPITNPAKASVMATTMQKCAQFAFAELQQLTTRMAQLVHSGVNYAGIGFIESESGRELTALLLTTQAISRGLLESGLFPVEDGDIAVANAAGLALFDDFVDLGSGYEIARVLRHLIDADLPVYGDQIDANAIIVGSALAETNAGLLLRVVH